MRTTQGGPMPEGAGLYVVVDIGCLECHGISRLIGTYSDHERALREARESAGGSPVVDTTDGRYDPTADNWWGDGVVAICAGGLDAEAQP